MRTKWMLIGVALLTVVLALGALACSDDDDDGGEEPAPTEVAGGDETPAATEDGAEGATINVSLTEFQIVPDVESAAAGSVTFNASNVGGDDHELVIIKTDLAPDALPTADDGSVTEDGEGIEVINEIEEFEPGGEQTLTVDLEAGAYVLICNVTEEEDDGTIESHYQEGMYVGFEVTE